MNHAFNTDLAKIYGVNEAIIIENLHFWIYKNKCNQKHFHDGFYWTYNSTRAFKEMFYYWSERQIDRIITSLKDQGAILIGNYNKVGYDRTRWFTLTTAVTDILPFGGMDITKSVNGFTQNVEPIPYINSNINSDIDITAQAEQLWSLYPNKTGKTKAMKKIPNLIKQYGIEKMENSIKKYIEDVKTKRKAFPQLNYKDGSTFFNGAFEDYINTENVKALKPRFEIVEVPYNE